MRIPTFSGLLVLSSLLLLTGCDFLGMGQAQQNLLDRLENSRDLWQQQNVDTYRFTYVGGNAQHQEGPFEVYVTDGTIDAVYQDDVPISGNDFLTIPEAFDLVEEAIRADADQFEMGFDQEYGFPVYLLAVYNVGNTTDSHFLETLGVEADALADNDEEADNGDSEDGS